MSNTIQLTVSINTEDGNKVLIDGKPTKFSLESDENGNWKLEAEGNRDPKYMVSLDDIKK